METIYVASEDLHGDLCYARTLSNAISYLIKTNWITKDTQIWDGFTCTLEEKFGLFGWTEAVENMDFNTFNTLFDPEFQIRSEPLIG